MDWGAFILIATLAVGAVLIVRSVRRKPTPPAAAAASPPVSAVPQAAPTAVEQLQGLSASLEALAEQTAHPRDFLGFEDFRRAVALMAGPDCGLQEVRQFAFGRLWTLACAAFEALRTRPDRADMLEPTVAQLRTFSPATLHYVVRFFASLDKRPPVGLGVAIAQGWWANHSMLIETFREDFATRAALGDAPDFGDVLSRQQVEPEAIAAFLGGVDHPFGPALVADMRRRLAGRLDEAALSQFGRFWRPDAAELLVEPAGWREALDQCQRAVLAARPRSVLVVGGPRMGKTAFLKLLALRLGEAGWRVFDASAADLMADQMYIGQIEGRVRRAVAELEVSKRAAWCVGDLSQLARSGTHQGQAASLLDQVWPAVAAGKLVLLAEASAEAASRTLQLRPSLASQLEVVRLAPLDETELATFVQVVANRLEQVHAVSIAPAARDEALHFAVQYLGAADAPGVAADVLRRAVERVIGETVAAAATIETRHVIDAVSQMTGLPAEILRDDEPIDLSQVRRFFADRVIGQDEAVATVVDRIAMLKAGLVDTSKPIGVFLFAGPTGTGKTELAKTLAEFLFGSQDRLIRLDMSEFQAPESVAKIVGERGAAGTNDALVERVRRRPFSVVLLDEFEKAHPNVWDLFLQVFDDGRLTDANGRTADLRHTIIILTSNLGAASRGAAAIGFSRAKDSFADHQVLLAVERAFRPEFVNRLDRIVVFKPLSRELMYRILRKELAAVLNRRGFRSRDWAVEWETSALDFLIEQGFSPEMGARPLKRAIDHHLLAPLAATLVEHRFPEGDQFLFVRSDGKTIEVEFVDPDAPAPVPGDGAEAPPTKAFDLAALVLRPQGGKEATAFLLAEVAAVHDVLASDDWLSLKTLLAKQTADPHIWERSDRASVFSRVNLIDRVQEAVRTVDRLSARLGASNAGPQAASADLVGRVALQVVLIRAGIEDALSAAPSDAVLILEPILDDARAAPDAAWRDELFSMYVAWAQRRRMQFSVVEGAKDEARVLVVSGFGAWRTLSAERGLHVLEVPQDAGRRREAVRVRVAEGPPDEPPAARRDAALRALAQQAPSDSRVRRRYRRLPAPLVRDVGTGERSGHLDLILGGDFDLVFPTMRLADRTLVATAGD